MERFKPHLHVLVVFSIVIGLMVLFSISLGFSLRLLKYENM